MNLNDIPRRMTEAERLHKAAVEASQRAIAAGDDEAWKFSLSVIRYLVELSAMTGIGVPGRVMADDEYDAYQLRQEARHPRRTDRAA